MKRREFITLAGSAAAWPVVARGQERIRRIGLLMGGADGQLSRMRIGAFASTLASLGWIEGRNIILDYRFDARIDASAATKLEVSARELLELKPDVILADGTPQALETRRQTTTTPIVFTNATDPLASGLITNVARPGGNVTGFTNLEFSIGGKWLGLLKEAAPNLKRVMVIMAVSNPGNDGEFKAIEAAGVRLGVEIVAMRVQNREGLFNTLNAWRDEKNTGLMALTFNIAHENRDLIIAHAERYRIPAIYPFAMYVTDGGLMSYGITETELYKKAAAYVDRILRGEKPGDLPVQYPTKYEFKINNKAARAIGLNIPETFLLLADEVIE